MYPSRLHSPSSAGRLSGIDMADTYTIYGSVVRDGCVIADGAVCVEKNKIVYSGPRAQAPVVNGVTEVSGGYILPGFIDIHCHAGGAVWSHEDPVRFAAHHLAHGTTGVCCTLYRDLGIDGMLQGIEAIKAAMPEAPSILGVHLEGPYLNPKYGAATVDGEIHADPAEYLPLLDTGIVRHSTFAPEVAGTDRYLADLRERGIVGSIGHSAASPEEVEKAVRNGARCVTHLFDATGASISPARWDGTIEVDFNAAALLCDELYYEIICDSKGVHVRPQMLQLVKKLAGVSRIIGVTDACTGSPDDGTDLNFENGELMGSKLTMDQVARNFHAAGFSLPEIAEVTSGNAARLLGLYHKIGSLHPGKQADIVVLREDFTVAQVYKA